MEQVTTLEVVYSGAGGEVCGDQSSGELRFAAVACARANEAASEALRVVAKMMGMPA